MEKEQARKTQSFNAMKPQDKLLSALKHPIVNRWKNVAPNEKKKKWRGQRAGCPRLYSVERCLHVQGKDIGAWQRPIPTATDALNQSIDCTKKKDAIASFTWKTNYHTFLTLKPARNLLPTQILHGFYTIKSVRKRIDNNVFFQLMYQNFGQIHRPVCQDDAKTIVSLCESHRNRCALFHDGGWQNCLNWWKVLLAVVFQAIYVCWFCFGVCQDILQQIYCIVVFVKPRNLCPMLCDSSQFDCIPIWNSAQNPIVFAFFFF